MGNRAFLPFPIPFMDVLFMILNISEMIASFSCFSNHTATCTSFIYRILPYVFPISRCSLALALMVNPAFSEKIMMISLPPNMK